MKYYQGIIVVLWVLVSGCTTGKERADSIEYNMQARYANVIIKYHIPREAIWLRPNNNVVDFTRSRYWGYPPSAEIAAVGYGRTKISADDRRYTIDISCVELDKPYFAKGYDIDKLDEVLRLEYRRKGEEDAIEGAERVAITSKIANDALTVYVSNEGRKWQKVIIKDTKTTKVKRIIYSTPITDNVVLRCFLEIKDEVAETEGVIAEQICEDIVRQIEISG